MKQRIFNFALISIGLFVGTFGFSTTDADAKAGTDPEVIVCPGRGERCVVNQNGLGNPFDRVKGKDDDAITIVFK